jgi:hypothetical protein
MAENFTKEAPETGKAKQTDEVFQKESGKDFGDIIKTDGETGKDFADLLKEDGDTGKDFVDALKEDTDTGKDFTDLLKVDADTGKGFVDSLKSDVTRLPRTGGEWEGEPGNSTWKPDGKENQDVPFVKKTVKDGDGKDIEVCVPVFDSVFDVQLPEDLYKATDAKQDAECNKQLKEAIEKNPELAKKFTPEQLEQIRNGDTPDGYTWHHNEETGKMQLVDSETHANTPHLGGKSIWGGGSENR